MRIRVAWLQPRNARNSPCKHLMLGWSPQILSPCAYRPPPPFNHHNRRSFITSGPASPSVCSPCGLGQVSAGRGRGLPVTWSPTWFITNSSNNPPPPPSRQTEPPLIVPQPAQWPSKCQHLERERSVSGPAALCSGEMLWGR